MKEVIRINLNKQEEEKEKPVEFTHFLNRFKGWTKLKLKPSDIVDIVYLGKCSIDGDMFTVYYKTGGIDIYKGHLNSGKY